METDGDGVTYDALTICGRHACLGPTSELALNTMIELNLEWVVENAVVISDREFFIVSPISGRSWKFWREE